MEDIYTEDQDGMRINASDRSLVKTQLFYLLASGSNGNTIVFKGSKECADYFGVTPKNVNLKISSGTPFIARDEKIEYKVSRRPI